VVFPFGSTEVIAATRRDGGRLWAAPVAGNRPGRAVALVTDITGDPVVAGNTVYVGSAAGRTAALDLRTGARLWDAAEGAAGPVWLAGGSLFQVGDDSELLRLDAATGEVVWRVPLPGFLRDNPRRQKGVHSHHGPVLAGGRVVVASSDGRVRFFAPESGAETGSIELPGGAAAPPAVAGGVLYLVSASGQLHAFR
jgi:outer membrane protein assembly factor BamB